MHRRPDLWVEGDKFMPERWLAKEGDPLAPIKGAWRPFEFGPRNCIGQELAILEMKVVMALTIRSFDTQAVYKERDIAEGKREVGDITRPGSVNVVEGDRAYQVLLGSAKPAGGMPVRVTQR